jgi:clan AA aspartic protease (TIGR02281 family)
MRQTCIGATGRSISAQLPQFRVHVWTVAFLLWLMCGRAQLAAASNYSLQYARFVTRQANFQPGPSVAIAGGGDATDSALPIATGPNLYSETYWTAFAELDLSTLRNAAQSDPEARFAEAMALIVDGELAGAESAFVALSQQQTDLNVAVASQIMLASTLRYERKWSALRDLPVNSRLGPDDRKMTSDLERWGRVFAGADEEVTTFPEKPQALRLNITAVGTPTVRVQINGKQYEFWLDTGSSMTVISSAVAKEAGIAPLSTDTLTVRTFAGSAPVRAATIRKMEIGSIVISNSPAVIIEQGLMYLRASARGVPGGGLRVDGIIGWDTIRQFDLTMDFTTGTITLRRPERHRLVGDPRQKLAWLGRPLVEVRTKAGAKLHFTLDTGAQTTFVNAAALERAGVSTRISANRVFGIAQTARQTDRVVPLLSLAVGRTVIPLENVIVYGPVTSGLINTDGILGIDVARYGVLHIDATNGVFSIGQLDAGEDAAE